MTDSEQHPDSGSGLWRPIVRIIVPVVFAGAMFHLFTDVVRFGTVVSNSMAPSLQIGDYYVLRVDAYRADRRPERGEVVVFRHSDGDNHAKRVVAVEQDTIAILGGRVFLNGSWLEEPYVRQDTMTREVLPMMPIPDNSVFVLGDNRNESEDSRDYGPISNDDVLGRVTKIVWPRNRARSLTPAAHE